MNYAPMGDDDIFSGVPVAAPFPQGGFNLDFHDGIKR